MLIVDTHNLVAGDYVEVMAAQDSGSGLAVNHLYCSFGAILLQGPASGGGGVAGTATGITYAMGGGQSVLTTGSRGFLEVPFDCTITAARLVADQTGSIVVDVKKATYAGLPTTASICASAKPTLSTARKSEDTTLTGWTTAVVAGDWLEYVIDSVATITQATLVLTATRS